MSMVNEQAKSYFEEFKRSGYLFSEINKINYDKSINASGVIKMSVLNYLDNLSIPLENINYRSVRVDMDGSMLDSDGNAKYVRIWDDKPVVSLVNFFIPKTKCFTFFSHLKPQWRNLSIDVQYMTLFIMFDKKWFPILSAHELSPKVQFRKLFLSIHSPNIIPELIEGQFIMLNQGNWYAYGILQQRLLL
jgi:hypothetical protein